MDGAVGVEPPYVVVGFAEGTSEAEGPVMMVPLYERPQPGDVYRVWGYWYRITIYNEAAPDPAGRTIFHATVSPVDPPGPPPGSPPRSFPGPPVRTPSTAILFNGRRFTYFQLEINAQHPVQRCPVSLPRIRTTVAPADGDVHVVDGIPFVIEVFDADADVYEDGEVVCTVRATAVPCSAEH